MNSSAGIFDFPVRGGKTIRTFDFILPKFYFSSPWRISVFPICLSTITDDVVLRPVDC